MIPASPPEYVQNGSPFDTQYPESNPQDKDNKNVIVIPLSVVGVT